MKNKKRTISASEVGKYMHCPYQWYYERYYGSAYIKQLKVELNKELGISRKGENNYIKGKKFHNNYFFMDTVKKIINKIIVFLFIILIATIILLSGTSFIW